jgi:acetyl-CoA acetyltransferase family protein
MTEVYVVGAVRTPVGKRNGYLRNTLVPELLGMTLDELVKRVGIDPALIEDNITGCVYQVGEQGFDIARMGVLASKFPYQVPGVSVNRQCGSSLTAIQMAFGMIAGGVMDIVTASGVEIMSKYPIGCDCDGKLPDGKPQRNPMGKFYLDRVAGKLYNQGMAANAIADQYGVTREDCEKLAVASHQKAHQATVNGYFKKEIMPTPGLDAEGNKIVVDKDEPIRPDTSLEKLATLKPALGSKWITAGISSPVTDGASAVMLMSEKKMNELKLTPLAKIKANAVVGSDPVLMLTGPIFVTPKVLDKAGLKMDDIDIFEVNEAFAPVPLAWAKELKADMDKLNVNGGAMALGHPVGNSGCRLVVTALHELQRRQGKYALVTLCTGGAMAPATIFERV